MRACALAAALVAAAFLPGERLGLAIPLVGALVLAAAWVAIRRSALRSAFAVLAFVLAAQAALLDATWVVAIDLASAWVLATLAASGVALEALVAPISRLREAPSLAPRPSERHTLALRGTAIGGVVVTPFLLLFLSADAAFAGLAEDIPLPSGSSVPGRVATLVLVLAAALGLGLAARTPLTDRERFPKRPAAFAEWAIPLALLDLLFVAFVTVQVAVLFGGHDRVLDTAGLTYAEYARSGFWQLLAATVLTFAVVGAALARVRPRSAGEALVLRVLLGALCALTLVVLVSALHRLRLYEDAFGLTRPRLLAETVGLWLGAMLALLAAAVWIRRARTGLPRAAVLVTAVGLLAFSFSAPDRRIADRNVDRWRETGNIDARYLAGLSADATPALLELPLSLREAVTARIRTRLADGDPWGSWNLSRARARDLLRG